jgi:NAD(P)-dependent dehydrogenase (short-subunit alcohol dehydrogenase family)
MNDASVIADQSYARAALISGASTGIGKACALALAERGWRVFAGVRKEGDREALRDADASGAVQPVMLDVTDQASIDAAVAFVRANLADSAMLAALINNAGIVVASPGEMVPIDLLREQFEVNTFGAVALTQAALPMLREARGRIICVSSISGRIAFPMLGPYAGSKFALGALMDSMRVELAETGVQVSLIEPGSVATPIWDKARDAFSGMVDDWPDDAKQRYGDLLTAIRASSAEKSASAMPVETVVDEVLHALSAKRAPAHRVIGPSTRWEFRIMRCLPWRWRDGLIRWGLAKRAKKAKK